MPRAVTSWAEFGGYGPASSLGPVSNVRSFESVPGLGCWRSRPQSQGEQQGHAELEGGDLVRLSLRAIDQHLSEVQRGECIWVPPCVQRGSLSRLERCRYPSAL